MKKFPIKKRQLLLCASFSLLAHLAVIYLARPVGCFHFAAPLADRALELQPATIELGKGGDNCDRSVQRRVVAKRETVQEQMAETVPAATDSAAAAEPGDGAAAVESEEGAAKVDSEEGAAAAESEESAAAVESTGKMEASAGAAAPQDEAAGAQSLRSSAIPSAAREKLTYEISILGVPLGRAVIEALHEGGNVRITTTIRSNTMIAGFYRIEDTAETRIMGGRYIISRLQQQEGSYRSDTGFTLCLQERKVFWFDRLNMLASTEPLQDDQATDLLTAIYLLRREPLQPGQSVQLHIFDSNRSVVTPVEVLRKEPVKLGSKEVASLVVRPALQAAGLFRRTGEVLIWLTDDQYKVPVRLETSISLGPVTAVLVSAETDRDAAPRAGAAGGAPSDGATAAGQRLALSQRGTP